MEPGCKTMPPPLPPSLLPLLPLPPPPPQAQSKMDKMALRGMPQQTPSLVPQGGQDEYVLVMDSESIFTFVDWGLLQNPMRLGTTNPGALHHITIWGATCTQRVYLKLINLYKFKKSKNI
jgi:hypothetical protein